MRYFSPDSDAAGTDPSRVPTDMEHDPNADEQVIDQRAGNDYPQPVEPALTRSDADDPSLNSPKIVPDDLSDSIAYAIDGSGPGPISSTSTGTEIMTDVDPDDEKAIQ